MQKKLENDILGKMVLECNRKFDEMLKQTLIKVLTGEIETYEQLIVELKRLDYTYNEEMDDISLGMGDSQFLDIARRFEKAEKEGTSLASEVRLFLKCYEATEESFNSLVWKNDDGQICDEYGNALSADGKHRVFKVIAGGGKL